jgi:hypothetical protein
MLTLFQWLGVLSAFTLAFAYLLIVLGISVGSALHGFSFKISIYHLFFIVAGATLGISQLVWYGWIS